MKAKNIVKHEFGLPQWLRWMCIRLLIRRLRVQLTMGRQHSFVQIDHEILSIVILSLLLIQEGQLSVSGESVCTILAERLQDKNCPVKWVR